MSDNAGGVSDEMVSQFLAFTGSADPSQATSYLEMSGGCIETAVGLYMEHNGTGAAGGGGGGGMMGGGMMGGGGGSDHMPPSMSMPSHMAGGDGEVRAPDATRTMRLMDDMNVGGHQFQMMNALMEEEIARSAFASSPPLDAREIVNRAAAAAASSGGGSHKSDDDDDDDDSADYKDITGSDTKSDGNNDDDVEIVGVTNGTSAPAPARLSDMFAPPSHLIHKAGGFEGARAVAKDCRRWLLVNLQRDEEFSCHALNRDVWRDELVENLVREGFIFWQTMDRTPEGQTYAQRYHVHDFPHIAIIDPRTRRLLWRKEGWTQENPVTASSFAEMAMDFCSRNTFAKPPSAPRPPNGVGGARVQQKRPLEMTESEQLEEALRNSLEDACGDNKKEKDNNAMDVDNAINNDDEVEVLDDAKQAATPTPAQEEEKPPSFNDELVAMNLADEPASGARIQFRMPDGKRTIRKFNPSDGIKIIYAFVAQSNDEAKGGREFTLMAGFPPRDLLTNIENTIESCKLAGEAITVRWK